MGTNGQKVTSFKLPIPWVYQEGADGKQLTPPVYVNLRTDVETVVSPYTIRCHACCEERLAPLVDDYIRHRLSFYMCLNEKGKIVHVVCSRCYENAYDVRHINDAV